MEAYRRDAASKDQLISELRATKKRLDSEVKELRRGLMQLQGDKASAEAERSRLQKEVSQVKQQMAALEGHLESVQRERDELEAHLQVWGHAACGGGARTAWGLSVRDAGCGRARAFPTRAGAGSLWREPAARREPGSEGRRGVPGERHGALGLWAVSAVGAASGRGGDGLLRTRDSPVVVELGAPWRGRESGPAAQRPVPAEGRFLRRGPEGECQTWALTHTGRPGSPTRGPGALQVGRWAGGHKLSMPGTHGVGAAGAQVAREELQETGLDGDTCRGVAVCYGQLGAAVKARQFSLSPRVPGEARET